VRETARKQKGLLESALRSLKAGGVLLYCTCSFSPEENELAVADLLRRFGAQVEVEPAALPVAGTLPGLTRWQGEELPAALAQSVRVLPDERLDGFYLCRLRRRAAEA
jgi:16S rRNA (cytosine1407-C5)-methyltransferase